VAAGDTTVRVFAQADQLQDAMQLQIPSQAYGTVVRDSQQRSLTQLQSEVTRLEVSVPQQVVPGSIDWQIQLAANPAAELLGALDYLVQYPYGCTEQTLSRFMPGVAVAQASRTLGIPLQSKTLAKLPATLTDGLQRLKDLQNADGGWGWWLRDSSNPYLTSYVLIGYHRAEAAGYAIDPETALKFLQKQVVSAAISSDQKMFAEYALSLYDKGSVQRILAVDPQTLSTFGQAYRVLALITAGDRQTAQVELDALIKQVSKEKSYVGFQKAALASSTRPLWERFTYLDAEIAGPMLQAATILNHPRADDLARWILSLRSGNRWLTTKETADAIVGLTTYYESLAAENPAEYTVEIRNLATGAILGEWTPTAASPYQVISLSPPDLTSDRLQPGSQTIEIEKRGSGPLYFSSDLEAFSVAAAGTQLGGSSQGFKVTRQYYTLTPQPQADGSLIYTEQELKGAIPAGETLLGRITVESDRDSNYVMVEEPLPSGAEVTSQDPQQLTGDGEENTYWWDWFWVEQDVRDNRITFFSTELPQGKHEFVYLFRPEIPGEFSVPPTQVEEMYDPRQRFGQSLSRTLQVVESPA
jgi:hypothetical protein